MGSSGTSSNSNGNGVDRRLRHIESRLARIESRLGITLPVEAEPTPAARPHDEFPRRHVTAQATTPRETQSTFDPLAELTPIAPQLPPAPAPPPLPSMTNRSAVAKTQATDGAPPPLAVQSSAASSQPFAAVLPYSTPKPQVNAPVPRGSLEQTIGLKWAGWVGAVVLVIGAAFGVKYVYDQRWLAAVPSGAWLSLLAMCGLGLIGAGEWVYRKVSQISAASLFGAGVATLFLAAYVGHAYWTLYPATTAFWLMAMTTLIGAAVAVRGRMVSTAVLSLVGGALAPALLGDRGAPIESFLAYLLTLQLVALGLAWWGGRPKWWTLRGLSLAITALWTSGVLMGHHRLEWSPIVFVLVSAALYHAEIILSTARATERLAARHVGGVFTTIVTAAMTAAVLWTNTDASDVVRTAWVLAFALATAATAWTLARSGRRLWLALSAAYQVQAVALLALSVPVFTSGFRVEIGWAILAVALAAVGRSLGSTIARWGAAAAWALGLCHLLMTAHTGTHAPVWLTVHGTELTSTAIMAWGLAIVAHVVGALLLPSLREPFVGRDEEFQTAGALLSGLGTALWIGASVFYLPALGATASIVGYAWALCGIDRIAPALGLNKHFVVLLALAALKWVAFDTLAERLSPGWSATQYLPVVNPVFGMGALIAASGLASRWLLRPIAQSADADPNRRGAGVSLFLWSIAALLLVWGGTVEIDRYIQASTGIRPLGWPVWQAEMLALTIWWSAAACAGVVLLARLVGTAARGRRELIDVLSFILIALAVKFLTVDTVAFRMLTGARPGVALMLNLQAMTAAVVCATMLIARRFGGDVDAGGTRQSAQVFNGVPVFAALVLLWAGSLEVDRALEQPWAAAAFAQPALAKHVALSVFWSLFAIGAVVIGFPLRLAPLRYIGLGLFAVTLLKVVTVDMSSVSTGYRILSFIGLGMLMLGTSVLYGKLSPALLRDAEASASGG